MEKWNSNNWRPLTLSYHPLCYLLSETAELQQYRLLTACLYFEYSNFMGKKIHATRLISLLNCANEVRTAQSSMEIFIWNCSKCTRESPAAGWLKTGGIAILLTHITAPANPKARPKGFVAIWLGNSYHSFHHKSSPDIHTGDYKVIKKLKNIYILKFGIRKKVI